MVDDSFLTAPHGYTSTPPTSRSTCVRYTLPSYS